MTVTETIVWFVKQAYAIPRNVSLALRRLKERDARADAEAERLDRIRNPLKYLGK